MIVEDDPVIRDELALLLSNEGYQTIAIAEFANVAAQVSEHDPNLILLDLNLPEQDGLSLCADIRKAGSTPIIFVTSRDSTADELHALSLGGDDYITKPHNIPVLLARNELKILSYLMNHAGKIVSRADLIEILWESQIYIDDNTLSVNVTRLRGKLEKLGLPDRIKTRRGLGYQL